MTTSSSSSRWYINRIDFLYNYLDVNLRFDREKQLDILKVKDWFFKNQHTDMFLCFFIDKTSPKFFYSFNEYIKFLEERG